MDTSKPDTPASLEAVYGFVNDVITRLASRNATTLLIDGSLLGAQRQVAIPYHPSLPLPLLSFFLSRSLFRSLSLCFSLSFCRPLHQSRVIPANAGGPCAGASGTNAGPVLPRVLRMLMRVLTPVCALQLQALWRHPLGP